MEIEWIVGALFVSLHAFKRYNTPVTNRCSTTFSQFAAYGVLYCLVMVMVYLFLAAILDSSPDYINAVQNFLQISAQSNLLENIDFVNQSKPFISALIVTTILPNAPWLKNFDSWLLQVFWDFGRIPYFVYQQAESLRRAGYIIDPGKRKSLGNYSKKYGIEIDSLSLDDPDKIDFIWARLASLQLSIDKWRSSGNGRTRRFISDNEREYSLIKNRTDDLSFQFSNTLFSEQKNDNKKNMLEKEFSKAYKRMIVFTAKALLISEHYQSDLQTRIRELGFGDLDFKARSISANQMVLILFIMFISFLALSFIFDIILSGKTTTISKLFVESLLMMMVYGSAVSCSLAVKNKPLFSYNELTSQRPWLGYFLSGLLAISIWFIVSWSFRYIYFMLIDPTTYICDPNLETKIIISNDASLVNKVRTHIGWSYPYMLQSFIIAVGLSFLVDRRIPSDKRLIAKMKIKDTIILTVLMFFISIGIYIWMYGIYLPDHIATKDRCFIKTFNTDWIAQLEFTLKHGFIGSVIGFLVPNWYRNNRSSGAYGSVARMISMNKEDLNNEARKLNPQDLLRAFTSITFWIANNKERIDRSELDVFDVTMSQLSNLNCADFSLEEAGNFLYVNKEIDKYNFLSDSLKAIASSEKIQMLCAWYAISVAYADHIYTEDEEKRVLEVFSMLPLLDPVHIENIKEFGRRSPCHSANKEASETKGYI